MFSKIVKWAAIVNVGTIPAGHTRVPDFPTEIGLHSLPHAFLAASENTIDEGLPLVMPA